MRRVISVIVPTYNEPLLAPFLDRLAAIIAPIGSEIVVVDDSDAEVHRDVCEAAAVARAVPVRVIEGEHRGKGAAVRRGVADSKGDVVLYIDADTSDERMHRIAEFVAMIESGGYDVVIAERTWKGRSPLRAFFSIALCLLQRWLVFQSTRFFDTQCGFKAFRRGALERIVALQTLDRGMYDVEYLAIAVTHGFRIARVPVEQMPIVRPSRMTVLRLLPLHVIDLLRVKRNLMMGRYST
ncbi:MAG: dolichyl-phosphate beta-glucosyltransferase [Thermoanaerobaculia bacterium]|jgi:glycosyltransferase involved in cell wall biosynthesis|nr:dolichyl-phosphate beta-glucosyltransferase [Thermoanaerobaculia bacterium]